MGATESTLSENLKRILLELLEEKAASSDFDTQSLSLAVFSTAHIGFSWEHSLSTLSRVSLRFCVVDCAPTFSSKEFYWSIMGLAKMVKMDYSLFFIFNFFFINYFVIIYFFTAITSILFPFLLEY